MIRYSLADTMVYKEDAMLGQSGRDERIRGICREVIGNSGGVDLAEIPQSVSPEGEIFWSYDGSQIAVLYRYPKGSGVGSRLEEATQRLRNELESNGFRPFTQQTDHIWRTAQDGTLFIDAKYLLVVA